mgnify:FL=1
MRASFRRFGEGVTDLSNVFREDDFSDKLDKFWKGAWKTGGTIGGFKYGLPHHGFERMSKAMLEIVKEEIKRQKRQKYLNR